MQKNWLIATVALIVLLLIGVGFVAGRQSAQSIGSLAKQRSAQTLPGLEAGSGPAAAVPMTGQYRQQSPQSPTPPRPQLPVQPAQQSQQGAAFGAEIQQIVSYLRWLRQFDDSRRAMGQRHGDTARSDSQKIMQDMTTGRPMGMLDSPDLSSSSPRPVQDAGDAAFGNMRRMASETRSLVDSFRQQVPPPACQQLASTYIQMLDTLAVAMEQQVNAVQQVLGQMRSGIPVNQRQNQAAMQQQSQLVQQQLAQLVRAANLELDMVRSRYPALPPDLMGFRIRAS